MQVRYGALALAMLVGCGSAPTAESVLAGAQAAMGNPSVVRYTAAGMNGFYGQSLTAGKEWPRREVARLVRSIDYAQRAAADEISFAQPIFGGQQQATFVNGDKAWSTAVNEGAPVGPTPQLAQAAARQLQIAISPHGFLRAAAEAVKAHAAKLTVGSDGSQILSFDAGRNRLVGTFSNSLLMRVATVVADPVLGDTDLTTTYSDYKTFGSFQAPTHIVQTQGGFPTWDIRVSNVDNALRDFAVPENVASEPAPVVNVMSTRLAPGVWYFTGGSHHSLAVEFPDFVAVVEAPVNEARSLAVIGEIHKVMLGKPISYVITTHHHFDHIGGLRTYVAQGATVVTQASNHDFLAKSLLATALIEPDAQSSALKKPKFELVDEKWILKGGSQRLEVYATHGDNHTNEMLIAYLPVQGILMEADSYTPPIQPASPPPAPDPAAQTQPDAQSPAPAPPSPPNALVLWDNIQRLKLHVRTIAPVHGRGAVPMAEFAAFVGKGGE